MKSISWDTPEYVHFDKNADWYWTVGIISVALVITSIIFGNILFAVVLGVGAFVLTLFASRKPRIIKVEVTDKAVIVDKTHLLYPTLQSFYIEDSHRHLPRLILRPKKQLSSLLFVPVTYENLDELKALLEDHLEEEYFEPSLVHALFEGLGF